MTNITEVTAAQLAGRTLEIMESGDLDDFEAVVHRDAVNREAVSEPPECRGRGPAAFHATALWLRAAFAGLRFEVHEVVSDRDLVVVHNTMFGRHTGSFAEYDRDGRISQVFPPTGRTFASTQTHWLRVEDGQIIEHWANRDDMATALQLGWIPPSPLYIVKMTLATRRARRAGGA